MKAMRGIIGRLEKNIDAFLAEADDNRTVFDKTIVDMKKGLAEGKELVATAIAEEARLKKALRDIFNAIHEYEKKIELALHNGKSEIVEKASQQKQLYLERATRLQQQITAQEDIVVHLKMGLREFYEKFQSTMEREESLRNRQKQAETHLQCYEILSRFSRDDENSALGQVERTVEKLEAHVEKATSNQGVSTHAGAQQEEDSLVRKKNVTEHTSHRNTKNVDEALEKLKKDLFRH